MNRITRIVAALVALGAFACLAEEASAESKWWSIRAYADVESAYISRGYIWDVRPYSAQFVDGALHLGPFGSIDASVWTMSATSDRGQSGRMSRRAYAEIDYVLRYTYDVKLAKDWTLSNGIARQWVTNPGYVTGRTLCDFQFTQSLQNPYLTPYWKLRTIRHPYDANYAFVGVKKAWTLLEGLSLTVDVYGDFSDRRDFEHLYGPKPWAPASRYRGGLQALNLVFRLDYALTEHVGLFAFVGQFDVVHGDARRALKATKIPEARRDLTYGGVGISVAF